MPEDRIAHPYYGTCIIRKTGVISFPAENNLT